MALAPIFVLALVCITLAFTVVGLSTFQLSASRQATNGDQALYLAEGAINQAMSLLHSGLTPGQIQFGRNNQNVYFPYVGSPQCGEVSFDITNSWGYSTNDFDGTQSTGWKGANVPSGMAMLLARGQVGSSVRMVQAFVEIPSFQYVLAVDGMLNSTVAPLVATADSSMPQYVADIQNNTPNTVLPANIGANGNVTAAANSTVSGDIISTGTVDLAPVSYVGGAVRDAHVDVPTLSVTGQINNWLAGAGANPNPFTPAGSGTTSVSADSYSSTSVTVPGDLDLQCGASIYVSGNLTVTGALYGVGQVFVNGSVTVNDGADLDAGNLVALVSTGDVSLQGPSGSTKYFQGLVYCEGAFSAANITIVGAFDAASNPSESTSASGTPSVTLNNAPLVYVPDATSITEPNALSLVSSIVGSPPNWYPGAVWKPGAAGGPYVSTLYNDISGGIGPTGTAILSLFDPTSLSLTSTGVAYNGVAYSMIYSTVQFDPKKQQFVPLSPPYLAFVAGTPPAPTSQAAFQAALVGSGCPYTLSDFETAMSGAQTIFAGTANHILNPGSGLSNTTLSLNLNNFLSNSNPLHIVSWREVQP